MTDIKTWKQLKVKTMWNGETIAYEEAKDGEFMKVTDHESQVKRLEAALAYVQSKMYYMAAPYADEVTQGIAALLNDTREGALN